MQKIYKGSSSLTLENFLHFLSVYNRSSSLLHYFFFRKLWRTIILGQVLSLLLCISQYLSHHLTTSLHLATPTSQNYLRYIFICSVFTTALAFRKGDKGLISVLKTRGYRYVLIGLIDLEASTLLATSHQFSSLINIQVCDKSFLDD